jgi:hypothetical protein
LDKDDLGPFICVPIPWESSEDIKCEPEPPHSLTGKRQPPHASLDQIKEDLVQLLIAERGFLSQAAQRPGGIGDANMESLRDEVKAHLDAVVAGLDRARWPDYVFEDRVLLPNLQSVVAFAREHKHLPCVVPAARVDARDFRAQREVASVLEHVEMSLLWLNVDAEEQISACAGDCRALAQRLDSLEGLGAGGLDGGHGGDSGGGNGRAGGWGRRRGLGRRVGFCGGEEDDAAGALGSTARRARHGVGVGVSTARAAKVPGGLPGSVPGPQHHRVAADGLRQDPQQGLLQRVFTDTPRAKGIVFVEQVARASPLARQFTLTWSRWRSPTPSRARAGAPRRRPASRGGAGDGRGEPHVGR